MKKAITVSDVKTITTVAFSSLIREHSPISKKYIKSHIKRSIANRIKES